MSTKSWAKRWAVKKRRWNQRILEQVGVADSSKDELQTSATSRLKVLEGDIEQLRRAAESYASSYRSMVDGVDDLATQLLMVSMRHTTRGSDPALLPFRKLTTAMTNMRLTAHQCFLDLLQVHIIQPLRNLQSDLPLARALVEKRRRAILDYDSRVRKVQSVKAKGKADRYPSCSISLSVLFLLPLYPSLSFYLPAEAAEIQSRKMKLDQAKAHLEHLTARLDSQLDWMEARRAQLVQDVAAMMVGGLVSASMGGVDL